MPNNSISHMAKWMPWSTALLTGAVLIIHFLPGADASLQTIVYPKNLGELMTWWSGHLSHWSRSHLLWDAIMLLALGLLLELKEKRSPLAAMLTGAPIIIAGTAWLSPDIMVYRGLSGLDCILAGMLCTCWLLKKESRMTALLFGGLLLGKAMLEVCSGNALFAGNLGPEVRPLASAHLVGFGWGILWESLCRFHGFARYCASPTR